MVVRVRGKVPDRAPEVEPQLGSLAERNAVNPSMEARNRHPCRLTPSQQDSQAAAQLLPCQGSVIALSF